MSASIPVPPDQIEFGVFSLDLRSGELRKRGVRLKLPEQSFQVLAMLLEYPGELVNREQLRLRLWPDGAFVDFDHSINSTIKSFAVRSETRLLRRALSKRLDGGAIGSYVR